ncbi:septum formation family protein [Nocardioides sp.]|uniref:septum formation family protein n=1 Tax=Nocardioides sp. TaxID=35761 RepID=UPI00351424C2
MTSPAREHRSPDLAGTRASGRRPGVLLIGLVTALIALAGCSGDGAPSPTPTAAPTSAKPTPAAAPPAAPPRNGCYRLTYAEAIAPTSTAEPVPCTGAHTTQTVAVGRVDAVVEGHLLAVDSTRVQARVGASCPAALRRYLGGSATSLQLSMIRPVWFTPTVEQSDAGAEWYRCDAVVLARASQLAPITGSLRGIFAGDRLPDRYAMCGTAAPGARNFQRVPCSARHTWRAIESVPLKAGAYPGVDVVRAAGRSRCENAAADRADDPLAFEWGYEWPTAEQWKAGQTFGRCWTRD